jgi:hypothetical protein
MKKYQIGYLKLAVCLAVLTTTGHSMRTVVVQEIEGGGNPESPVADAAIPACTYHLAIPEIRGPGSLTIHGSYDDSVMIGPNATIAIQKDLGWGGNKELILSRGTRFARIDGEGNPIVAMKSSNEWFYPTVEGDIPNYSSGTAANLAEETSLPLDSTGNEIQAGSIGNNGRITLIDPQVEFLKGMKALIGTISNGVDCDRVRPVIHESRGTFYPYRLLNPMDGTIYMRYTYWAVQPDYTKVADTIQGQCFATYTDDEGRITHILDPAKHPHPDYTTFPLIPYYSETPGTVSIIGTVINVRKDHFATLGHFDGETNCSAYNTSISLSGADDTYFCPLEHKRLLTSDTIYQLDDDRIRALPEIQKISYLETGTKTLSNAIQWKYGSLGDLINEFDYIGIDVQFGTTSIESRSEYEVLATPHAADARIIQIGVWGETQTRVIDVTRDGTIDYDMSNAWSGDSGEFTGAGGVEFKDSGGDYEVTLKGYNELLRTATFHGKVVFDGVHSAPLRTNCLSSVKINSSLVIPKDGDLQVHGHMQINRGTLLVVYGNLRIHGSLSA